MFTYILALMVWLVPLEQHQFHEAELEQTAHRYATIARAIADEAGPDRELALYLLTVARHESSFVLGVHQGKIRGDRRRSWGLFQVMVSARPTAKVWAYRDPPFDLEARDLVGTDLEATRRAVAVAAWILRDRIANCQSSPRCTFMAYGGVPAGPLRGATRRRILGRVHTYHRACRELTRLEELVDAFELERFADGL